MEKNNTNTYIIIGIIIVLIIGAVFYFRGKQELTPGEQNGEVTAGTLEVKEVTTRLLESFPLQVEVTVRGEFSDACTKIGDIIKRQEGNTFFITINATREANAVCAQVITPFEKKIILDVAGLAAGTYTINVNGALGSFTLTEADVFQGGKL